MSVRHYIKYSLNSIFSFPFRLHLAVAHRDLYKADISFLPLCNSSQSLVAILWYLPYFFLCILALDVKIILYLWCTDLSSQPDHAFFTPPALFYYLNLQHSYLTAWKWFIRTNAIEVAYIVLLCKWVLNLVQMPKSRQYTANHILFYMAISIHFRWLEEDLKRHYGNWRANKTLLKVKLDIMSMDR